MHEPPILSERFGPACNCGGQATARFSTSFWVGVGPLPGWRIFLQNDVGALAVDSLGSNPDTRPRISVGGAPGFEPEMEFCRFDGSSSCGLVLVFGLSSSPVLPRVRALLDYVRTTAAGSCPPALLPLSPSARQAKCPPIRSLGGPRPRIDAAYPRL